MFIDELNEKDWAGKEGKKKLERKIGEAGRGEIERTRGGISKVQSPGNKLLHYFLGTTVEIILLNFLL